MPPSQRLVSFRLALAERDLRLLLASLAISTTGDWFYSVALVVYVFDKTHSAAWIAATSIVRLAPFVIFAPLAGDLADRLDRRILMIGADITRAVLMAALAVAAALSLAPGLVLALAFACATAGTPYIPAVTALTPMVVPETALAAANALVGTVNYVALILGPAFGTLAVVLGSPKIAFAINAAAFAASAAAVRLMRRVRVGRSDAGSARFFLRAAEGMRPILHSRETAVLAGFFVGQAWIYGLESVLLVLAARSLLGIGVSGYGWLLAAIGVGGLVAGPFSGRLSGLRTPTLLLGAGVFAVGLPLASLSLISRPWIAYATLTLDGAGTLLTEVLAITALQRTLREDLIGRVFAAMDALAFAAVIAGSALAPVLVDHLGLRLALVVAGASGPVATIALMPWIRNVDRTARDRVAALQPTIDVLAGSAVFRGAQRFSLELLATSLTGVRAVFGQVIIGAGDVPDSFFVIVEGTFLVLASDDGRVLQTLGPGDHFGEIGILRGIPRTATVRAETPGKLFRIEAADFLGVINKSPTVRGALLDVAAARLA